MCRSCALKIPKYMRTTVLRTESVGRESNFGMNRSCIFFSTDRQKYVNGHKYAGALIVITVLVCAARRLVGTRGAISRCLQPRPRRLLFQN